MVRDKTKSYFLIFILLDDKEKKYTYCAPDAQNPASYSTKIF